MAYDSNQNYLQAVNDPTGIRGNPQRVGYGNI